MCCRVTSFLCQSDDGSPAIYDSFESVSSQVTALSAVDAAIAVCVRCDAFFHRPLALQHDAVAGQAERRAQRQVATQTQGHQETKGRESAASVDGRGAKCECHKMGFSQHTYVLTHNSTVYCQREADFVGRSRIVQRVCVCLKKINFVLMCSVLKSINCGFFPSICQH